MTQTTTGHRRSYSQVDQVRRCGWAYKLKRIDRLPERPSAAAVGGSAVHAATEVIDADWPNVDVDAARTIALDYVADEVVANPDYPVEEWTAFGWKPKQDLGWWLSTGIPNALTAYVDWRRKHPSYSILSVDDGPAIEVEFDIQLGEVRIVGKIDRVFVDENNGTPFVLDIKTGRKPETDEQLGLYRAALAARGVFVDYGVYVFGLKRGLNLYGDTMPIDLTHWTAEKLHSVYSPANQAIDARLFIPHPGSQCQICSFNDRCAYAQSAL